MNKTEKYLISYLRAAAFMIVCLLAFSAETKQDREGFNGHRLTSETQQIQSLAIPNLTNDGSFVNHPIGHHGDKSRFNINYKADSESHLHRQRFITQRKSRESIIPFSSLRFYFSVTAEKKDAPPDLG